MTTIRVKSKVDEATFTRLVFGGDMLIEQFPRLFTEEGVTVATADDGNYYILNSNGRMVSDTHFFTPDELSTCLEQV